MARQRSQSHHGQSHLHLTNCIHLRNHHSQVRQQQLQQRNSPSPGMDLDHHLMRDLVLLQRSKSLRDPSTSPPSWFSPSEAAQRARGKYGNRSEAGRLSTRSSNLGPARVAAIEAIEEAGVEPVDRVGGGGNGLVRRKKRRVKGVVNRPNHERAQGVRSNASVNSSSQEAVFGKGHMREFVEDGELLEMSPGSRKVCGIPWNWSGIHNKGKSFLACGLSNSKEDRGDGTTPPIHRTCLNLNSVTSSESEVLPLLTGSSMHSYLQRRYSGELGIFSNQSVETDSDFVSDSRSRNRLRNRHRSIIQKYAPKTFKDIIGQNLVIQALSNAIVKRKIGSVYLFYGSHGTGKTSCARVFAKALNCTSTVESKPCDTCSSCMSYNIGKSKGLVELGPVGTNGSNRIVEALDKGMLKSAGSSEYKVFILEDCENLPAETWGRVSKVIDRAARNVVFIFISSGLDLPHSVVSKCQKFFFPKIKERDIVNVLKSVAVCEDLEADEDALRLIAARCDGSLRDAEMMLEQLSLIGQRISAPLVQELIGVVSDDKLVDLLDMALSADTANTVKCLREITEAGMEPMVLMSQLATIITDILAGTYLLTIERPARRFFLHPTISKEDTERLRQALKVLSEAEKQLRISNDKITWLTAALLQLAPDAHYVLPSPSPGRRIGLRASHNPTYIQSEIMEEEAPESGLALPNASASQVPRQLSIVKGKVSLAQVINRVEAGGWSRQKAMSIAEKLEKQNLRLESRSRSFLCCGAYQMRKPKSLKLNLKSKKRNFHISNLVACGRGCLCTRTSAS